MMVRIAKLLATPFNPFVIPHNHFEHSRTHILSLLYSIKLPSNLSKLTENYYQGSLYICYDFS
jgi:hypothetical protein